jgi:hypothetical protein
MPHRPLKLTTTIYTVEERIPEDGALLMLHFADGSRIEGVRVKEQIYWSRGKQVFPERWQLLPRVGMILGENERGGAAPNP